MNYTTLIDELYIRIAAEIKNPNFIKLPSEDFDSLLDNLDKNGVDYLFTSPDMIHLCTKYGNATIQRELI
jgi:acyl-coenzyme A synthetase/AMP-(fatty) acid ligase